MFALFYAILSPANKLMNLHIGVPVTNHELNFVFRRYVNTTGSGFVFKVQKIKQFLRHRSTRTGVKYFILPNNIGKEYKISILNVNTVG